MRKVPDPVKKFGSKKLKQSQHWEKISNKPEMSAWTSLSAKNLKIFQKKNWRSDWDWLGLEIDTTFLQKLIHVTALDYSAQQLK